MIERLTHLVLSGLASHQERTELARLLCRAGHTTIELAVLCESRELLALVGLEKVAPLASARYIHGPGKLEPVCGWDVLVGARYLGFLRADSASFGPAHKRLRVSFDALGVELANGSREVLFDITLDCTTRQGDRFSIERLERDVARLYPDTARVLERLPLGPRQVKKALDTARDTWARANDRMGLGLAV